MMAYVVFVGCLLVGVWLWRWKVADERERLHHADKKPGYELLKRK